MTKQHELYRIQSEINNMCDVHCDVCVACDVMKIDYFRTMLTFRLKKFCFIIHQVNMKIYSIMPSHTIGRAMVRNTPMSISNQLESLTRILMIR